MLLNIPGISTIKINPNQQVKIQRALNALYVGQILKADVIKISSSNRLILQIGGHKVQAQTSHAYKPGDTLHVKVKSNGAVPELEVMGKEIKPQTINQAIRQVLPQQVPPKQLLNSLNWMNLQTNPAKAQQNTAMPSNEQSKPTHPQTNQVVQSKAAVNTQSTQGKPIDIKLPAQVRHSINQLINNLSSNHQVSNPSEIKQSIQNSGQFFESNLLNRPTGINQPLQQDYKGNLFNLLKTIDIALTQLPKPRPGSPNTATSQQTPDAQHVKTTSSNHNHSKATKYPFESHPMLRHESLPLKGAIPQPIKGNTLLPLLWENTSQLLTQLKHEVSHALARVQANQLASLSTDSVPPLLLDLPIKQDKGIDVMPLLIEQRDAQIKQGKSDKIWSVMVAMNLENLGEMQIKVSMYDNKVNVNFWSPEQNTLNQLHNNQQLLNEQINSLGLMLDNFNTYLGLRENDIAMPKSRLLDIKI